MNLVVAIWVLTVSSLSHVIGHSWMSCPLSFNRFSTRGGSTVGPCEVPRGSMMKTPVSPGQRMKVQWTSNNHGGGYVKLNLFPASLLSASQAERDKYVLKMACYGHDQRPGRFQYGDCGHPCNARPACQWQKSKDDIERFDTTVAIPANLPDGDYILQWVSLVGNSNSPYYSCATLELSGGNPGIKCGKPSKVSVPNCLKSGGPEVSAILPSSAEMGPFCFDSAGSADVDFNIASVVPFNRNCEGRLTCDLSVQPTLCQEDFGGSSRVDPDFPFQASCPVVPGPTATKTSSSSSKPSTTSSKPPVSSSSSSSRTVSTVSRFTTTSSSRSTSRTSISSSQTTSRSTSKSTVSSSKTTSKSTSKTTSESTSKTTSSSSSAPKPTSSIIIGGKCSENSEIFVCFGDNLARCVYETWLELRCPAGTKCVTKDPSLSSYCDHAAV